MNNNIMSGNEIWSNKLLKIARNLNRFVFSEKRDSSTLFLVNNERIGILTSAVATELLKYSEVFTKYNVDGRECVKLSDSLVTYGERSRAVGEVIVKMREANAHVSLLGWRNEMFEVSAGPNQPVLFEMERAAISMFGIRSYGSHMNGYVKHPDKGLCLWIARRSNSKATFPGMLDNMVAGGKGSGIGIRETILKECQEEAGIPLEIAENVVSVGLISYIYEDERGVQSDVQYCFDLEIPVDFTPQIVDGEVQEFKLCTIEEVKELIVRDDFKPNCAAVTLHFLIRWGFVTPDTVDDYVEINQLLHYKF